ncbi:MAG: phosphatase PAP2 family protein [Caldilineaceae bacterium]
MSSPNSPSYPAEHAVVAGAASAVLAYLLPDEADQFTAKAEEAAHAQLLAGTHYPSDVEAGLALGRAVAEKVIERAQNDGADAEWTGEVPTGPGDWIMGDAIFMPMAGTWQTWLLDSNDQLRPPPPPTYDSPERAAELAEIKSYPRTLASNAAGFYWQSAAGNKNHWFEATHRLLFESEMDENPPLAALIYATVSVGIHDAFVACFDGKYTYWTIRPSQLDPEIVPLFPNPPHPSYPAAHACNSGAGSTVLASFFPANSEALLAVGQEGGQSRLWAGIHYQSDIDEGLKIGKATGEMAFEHAQLMMQP